MSISYVLSILMVVSNFDLEKPEYKMVEDLHRVNKARDVLMSSKYE